MPDIIILSMNRSISLFVFMIRNKPYLMASVNCREIIMAREIMGIWISWSFSEHKTNCNFKYGAESDRLNEPNFFLRNSRGPIAYVIFRFQNHQWTIKSHWPLKRYITLIYAYVGIVTA
jgi:hypothetical protein